jgi:phosphatidylserine/phosphatidylglycerophosphate/cardiolipin synthase-like enzyme
VAIYEFNLWSLRDALLDAHQRGLQVRMVTDSSNLDSEELQELKEAGIPILGDRRESLMHNKFVVIDRLEVWTGSMNFTITDGYRNHNNLLRLHSSQAAQNYTHEFEEMFEDDLFGQDVRADTPHPSFEQDGTDGGSEHSALEVLFSPDDGTAGRLAELISGARQNIYFLAFSFTLEDLADAILERAAAGVEVKGVMDESQVRSNVNTQYDILRRAGLDVRLDANPDKMHHKVFIIDNQIVVTGSYNFSNSAETRNDENTLILYNQEVAEKYLEEFQTLFQAAER